MIATKRELTIADIAEMTARSAECAEAKEVYRTVERVCADTIGWHLFTILGYVDQEATVERLYSTNATAYPVGGRKPLNKTTANHVAMERGEVFLAPTKESVRRAFIDHELIFRLGVTAILNVPIRHAGRRLGTLNLCGSEGMYGPAEISRGRIVAGLLVPSLLEAMG